MGQQWLSHFCVSTKPFGLKGFISILNGVSWIISVTSFPVPAPRLRPSMEWPVATTRFLYRVLRPIYGSPSAEHGRNPDHIFSFSGILIEKDGMKSFTAAIIPFTLLYLGE